MAIDLSWREAVRAVCDPVLASADVGFAWSGPAGVDVEHPALLWEADPNTFAARYPDSRIRESYGDQWPPPCIDFWVYVDPSAMTAEVSLEGWGLSRETWGLTGDGARDGCVLATRFAEILRVPPPAGSGA